MFGCLPTLKVSKGPGARILPWLMRLPVAAAVVGTAWLSLYMLITWLALPRLATDFYGGMPADLVRAKQSSLGIKVAAGPTWVHLAWLADPERERYLVYSTSIEDKPPVKSAAGAVAAEPQPGASLQQWAIVDEASFGSSLIKGLSPQSRYRFKVVSVARDDSIRRTLGVVVVATSEAAGPVARPVIASPWRPLFRPHRAGNYVNDHTLFRDAHGCWRLWGITGPGKGDYSRETLFAQGWMPCGGTTDASAGANPGLDSAEMIEAEPIADYGEIAWAPHVLREPGGTYHAFWSPHRAPHAVSRDGITWRRVGDAIERPFGWFFRDPMLFEAAPGQWLMYVSARGWYFSRIDVYQSFDLDNWQFIRSAWTSSWGSERNAVVGSAESPFVMAHDGNYYLSITYNNESGLIAPIALALGYWVGGGDSYNDTLIFASDNPYEFGEYRGSRIVDGAGEAAATGASMLSTRGSGPAVPLARLQTHAPEYVHDEATGRWYVTSCGWPLAATLSTGEVIVARLRWETGAVPVPAR